MKRKKLKTQITVESMNPERIPKKALEYETRGKGDIRSRIRW